MASIADIALDVTNSGTSLVAKLSYTIRFSRADRKFDPFYVEVVQLTRRVAEWGSGPGNAADINIAVIGSQRYRPSDVAKPEDAYLDVHHTIEHILTPDELAKVKADGPAMLDASIQVDPEMPTRDFRVASAEVDADQGPIDQSLRIAVVKFDPRIMSSILEAQVRR